MNDWIASVSRVDPRYGTMADFEVCLDAAHARGMRVITEARDQSHV